MIAILNYMGQPYHYESREAFLKSISNIWKNNGTIRSNSEGYKADGIVRHGEIEIMLIKACGAYGNKAMSKIQFDRHKGLYACLAMLRSIAVKYKHANSNTLKKLKILFLHSKDCFLQLWSISFVNDMLVFHRVDKCELSLDFEFKSQTISNCFKFAHTIKDHSESTVNLINCLSAEHTEAINNDMLGLGDLNEENSLESIVRPKTHKIKDDTGLYYEDPVSCAD